MNDTSHQNVLALDTSSATLRLCLKYGPDRQVKLSEDIGTSHGQTLIRKMQDLLASAGVDVARIGALVVCTGPGSFTGLRIGLAAAKGMAEALSIPIVGVSLFEIASSRLTGVADEVCVVAPFKRDECFIAVVPGGRFDPERIEAVRFDRLQSFIAGRPFTSIGLNLPDGIPASSGGGVPAAIEYDAADLIRVAEDRLAAGDYDDLSSLQPLYVQRSQAELRYEQHRRDQ